jgi:hypothetical protein
MFRTELVSKETRLSTRSLAMALHITICCPLEVTQPSIMCIRVEPQTSVTQHVQLHINTSIYNWCYVCLCYLWKMWICCVIYNRSRHMHITQTHEILLLSLVNRSPALVNGPLFYMLNCVVLVSESGQSKFRDSEAVSTGNSWPLQNWTPATSKSLGLRHSLYVLRNHEMYLRVKYWCNML